MVINLYTPGHGDPLETLIVNGIVLSLIEEHEDAKIDVLKQGSRFIVKISGLNNIDERKVLENTVESVIDDCKLWSLEREVLLSKIGLSFKPQPAVKAESILRIIRDEALSYINSTSLSFVKEFSQENHMTRWDERRNRKKKGRLFKVHIQIAPFAGSYMRLPYVTTGTAGGASFKSEEADYVVCPFCLIFSLAGLVKSTSIISYSTKKKSQSLFISPSPLRATQDDIALLGLIFGEKVEVIGAEKCEIPSLGGILYSIVSGETVGALSEQSLFDAVYWVCSKEGNFISVREFGSVPLLNLYRFVTEAKKRSQFLTRLVNKIAEDQPELLELLCESLVFSGYDAYNVVRSIWAFLEKMEKTEKIPLDLGIVSALIESVK